MKANPMTEKLCFVAFAGRPEEIRHTIAPAVIQANQPSCGITYESWIQNDIPGRILIDPIYQKINRSTFVVADISVMNFNVIYEIGYTIGVGKRAFLIRHSGIQYDEEAVRKIGVFDTLGHKTYDNSSTLSDVLRSITDFTPIPIKKQLNARTRTWVLQTPHRTEAMGRIIARVKKEMHLYRSFDPTEQARLPVQETIDEIASSTGVVIPLMGPHLVDSHIHNSRAAFVAGVAHGLGKVTLILQDRDTIVPLDVRDFVRSYRHPQDIDDHIRQFRDDVDRAFYSHEDSTESGGQLENLYLGAPTAENEFQTLNSYYIKTNEYNVAIRGAVNLVIGRKGSGKTALFSQVRNELRRDKANVIVDLKPEGYQLLKLKDIVLKFLEAGSKAHLVIAFWDYILLLEIAHKLLEKDRDVYNRDPKLEAVYRKLTDVYQGNGYSTEGDFSERLIYFSNHVGDSYQSAFGKEPPARLSHDNLTQILYRHDLRKLRTAVSEYLSLKDQTWVLFDNIDKGWSTHGVSEEDIVIMHSLVEAAWKIQRDMQKDEHDFYSLIFLRNDVYNLLVKAAPDRGKDIKVVIDWNDPEALKELIRRRLVYNGMGDHRHFREMWDVIVESSVDGEDSADYIIKRSLMRPRYLLLILNHCRGVAVNFGHSKITSDDIKKGLLAYSNDLIVDTDNELRDVFPKSDGLIYQFMNEESDLLVNDLHRHFERSGLSESEYEKVTEFLLWYGVVGIVVTKELATFIFDVGYDLKKLTVVRDKAYRDTPIYRINTAYWPGLSIKPAI